jgi:hypothetical protein
MMKDKGKWATQVQITGPKQWCKACEVWTKQEWPPNSMPKEIYMLCECEVESPGKDAINVSSNSNAKVNDPCKQRKMWWNRGNQAIQQGKQVKKWSK